MAIPSSLITGSVGIGGRNQQADVRVVQTLLNAVPAAKGGPLPTLDVDGFCGMLTAGAIKRFQGLNTGYADGRVDPGQATERALLALLEALGRLAAILAAIGASLPAQPPAAPPVASGADTPIRKRFMEICKALLPAPGMLTAGGGAGPRGTGCGEFPGRVFRRVPVLLPHQPGAFKLNVPKAGILYLTSPTTWWEEFAQEIDAKLSPPKKTWVPFTGSNRPLPGDIYLLSMYDAPSKFQHVGVIVDPAGSTWMTADGGQGGTGWQSGFMKRDFEPGGVITGEQGKKARLKGWVDLDAIFAVAVAAFPDNL